MKRYGWINRFKGDRNGSPALEFALIAPLFFAAVFGAMELGRGLYERNRFNAAAAIATRTIALDPDAGETDIKASITAKLGNYNVNDLTITIGADETIAGQTFKKIEISYDFDFLVNIGHGFNGVTLTSTRYAPVMASS